MRNTQTNFKIALTGILCALIAVLTFTGLGMLPLSFVSVTTMFIPVAIGIVLLDDYRVSIILGFAFGLCSLIKAIGAASPIDALFINPLVSIAPRVTASFLAHFIYRLLKPLLKGKIILLSIVAGVTVPFFNTIITVPTLLIFGFNAINDLALSNNITVAYFIFIIIGINALCEIVFGGIISIVICKSITSIENRLSEDN